MKNRLISVSDVERVYATNETRLQVLDQVSFQLDECESVALVGASGSGKSTLVHCMAGLDAPQSGTIYFREHSIYDQKSSWLDAYRKDQIGLVFQHYHLVEELDALNNVLLASGSEWGNAQLQEEAKELLNLLGLSERLHHRPSELSGVNNSGWRLRVHSSINHHWFSRMSPQAIWMRKQERKCCIIYFNSLKQEGILCFS